MEAFSLAAHDKQAGADRRAIPTDKVYSIEIGELHSACRQERKLKMFCGGGTRRQRNIKYKQNLLYPVAHSRTLARTHPIRPSLTQTL